MDFYGDETRWFIGKVAKVDDDPTRTGRIKVKIFGLHDDPSLKIPDDLPYAQVLAPTTEGGGSGIGNNGIGIQPQSLAFGIFIDGKNSQLPLVLGSIPTNENFHRELVNKEKTSKSPLAEQTDYSNVGNYKSSINIELTGSSNVEKAWNWFLSEAGGGYSPEQVAGLLGNFWIESGPGGGSLPNDIDPRAENPSKEASRGIAQWNPMNKGEARDYIHPGSRLAKLQRYAASLQLNWLSLKTQLLWVTKELETLGLKAGLLSQKTTADAAFFVCKRYEVPKGYKNYNSKTNRRRRNAAKELLDQLTSGIG